MQVLLCNKLRLYDMGTRATLSVGEKNTSAYKEQYPCASQQNISNYFSLLLGKLISRRCVHVV
jgi:hypothetical protein